MIAWPGDLRSRIVRGRETRAQLRTAGVALGAGLLTSPRVDEGLREFYRGSGLGDLRSRFVRGRETRAQRSGDPRTAGPAHSWGLGALLGQVS